VDINTAPMAAQFGTACINYITAITAITGSSRADTVRPLRTHRSAAISDRISAAPKKPRPRARRPRRFGL
jgi:hypothetical protein